MISTRDLDGMVSSAALAALGKLPPETAAEVLEQAERLRLTCHQMGEKSALLLLAALGVWLARKRSLVEEARRGLGG